MKENETPKGIVNQLESVSVSLSAFIELNNTRFFAGKLKAASKLRKGTKLLIPTNEMGDRKSSSSLPPLPFCALPLSFASCLTQLNAAAQAVSSRTGRWSRPTTRSGWCSTVTAR